MPSRNTILDQAAGFIRRRHRTRWAEAMPWVLAILAILALPQFLALGTQIVIMILFALSLDLILGFAGIVTLGHAAFFGVGAYAAGLLSVAGWGEPITGLLVGAGAAALIGAISGWILLRTHGLTLLMLTLATTITLEEFANFGADITGGFDGLVGIEMQPLFGFLSLDGTLLGLGLPFSGYELDPLDFTHSYLYALIVLFVLFVLIRRIVYAPFGRTLVGIRENVTRMHAVGTPVHNRLVTSYTISAAIAGVAGALSAQTEAFVTLQSLSFELSGEILIMLILGGTGRLYGAFIGVAAYMILEDQLAKFNPELWQFGVGLMLVLTVLFARRGLLGLAEDASHWIKASAASFAGSAEHGGRRQG